MVVDEQICERDQRPPCRCNGGERDEGCDALIAVRPATRRMLRVLAFHYLYVVDRSDYTVSVDEAIDRLSDGFGVMNDSEDSFARDLVIAAVENRDRYEDLITPLLQRWRFDRVSCCIRLILYLALAEFERSDAIASVVINEAIELSQAYSEKDSYRFINGILDQLKDRYPHSLENDFRHSQSLSQSSSSSSSSEESKSEFSSDESGDAAGVGAPTSKDGD